MGSNRRQHSQSGSLLNQMMLYRSASCADISSDVVNRVLIPMFLIRIVRKNAAKCRNKPHYSEARCD